MVIEVLQNCLTSLNCFMFMVFAGIVCLLLLRWFLAKSGIVYTQLFLTMQLVFQGAPSKEVDSAKESSRPEKPSSVFTKRSSQTATLQHKKPASSVDAEIVGGSTLSSQAMLKQEVSTASSKGTTLKEGMLL